ncbi:MAG: zinc-dependent peptidase [Candidatus Hydrogenedentes bacterium]|nr:zinc-dependent peptidase [Candidatus Hydrogenedentota bacterium]
MFGFRKKKREKKRSLPFPREWDEILARNVPYFLHLPLEGQDALRGHINVLLAEKNFEGCGGLEMTDEIRVTIAAYAAILMLNRDVDYYPGLASILVYPDAFVVPDEPPFDDVEVLQEEDVRLGESWTNGAIVLSWKSIANSMRKRGAAHNVILHEFAHQVDFEDGITDGVPLLDDNAAHAEWTRVMTGAYEALWQDIEKNRNSWLDEYGATDPAEFFAVLTETFFMRPHTLQRKHPDVYAVLREYYRQDPAAIMPKI